MEMINGASVLSVNKGTTIVRTPAVTAGIYTAGDVVGEQLTFANATRNAGGGGVVKSMVIIDDAGQDAALELWLFSEAFTAINDNAAWSTLPEADLHNLVAIIATADGSYFAAGTASAARVEASQRYDLAGTSLFGQLVTRATPTYVAVDDITVILGVLVD